MDASETYIKMCDCKEMQGLRSERIKKKEWWDEGDFSNYPPDGINVYAGHYTRQKGNIWLPRQDQLQEMVGYKGLPYLLAQMFERSVNGGDYNYTWDNGNHFTSMEQLWLAFVMKEKHNKTWDGDKWLITTK